MNKILDSIIIQTRQTKTNQEALNELHNKIIGLQEEIKKSAEIASRILSAVLTQAPAMDFPLNEVRKAFEDTTSDQNQKLAESHTAVSRKLRHPTGMT